MTAEPRAKPARRRRYLPPMQIIAIMRSATPEQQATGRRILRERYGYKDENIDLLMSRGAATGKAPIAASHLALCLPKRDRLQTQKPEGANEVLDWFFSHGRKLR